MNAMCRILLLVVLMAAAIDNFKLSENSLGKDLLERSKRAGKPSLTGVGQEFLDRAKRDKKKGKGSAGAFPPGMPPKKSKGKPILGELPPSTLVSDSNGLPSNPPGKRSIQPELDETNAAYFGAHAQSELNAAILNKHRLSARSSVKAGKERIKREEKSHGAFLPPDDRYGGPLGKKLPEKTLKKRSEREDQATNQIKASPAESYQSIFSGRSLKSLGAERTERSDTPDMPKPWALLNAANLNRRKRDGHAKKLEEQRQRAHAAYGYGISLMNATTTTTAAPP